MKKLLKKITVFTLLSLVINAFLILPTAAITNPSDLDFNDSGGEDFEPNETLNLIDSLRPDDKKVDPCLPLPTSEEEWANADQYPALEYIVTIIEEPLNISESDESLDDRLGRDDFIEVTCFRNVFRFVDPIAGKEYRKTEPALAKECSQNDAELANAALDPSNELHDYKVAHSCKKVLVLLTRGGTSTIEAYIGTIYRWGASLAGLIAVSVIVLNGIRISVSGGDSQAVENAKSNIVQSIGGLVVLFLSGLILYTVNPNFFVQ